MAYCKSSIPNLLVLILALSVTDCNEGSNTPPNEASGVIHGDSQTPSTAIDALVTSLQETIASQRQLLTSQQISITSLTNALAQQTEKISELATSNERLNKATLEIELLKIQLSVTENTITGLREDVESNVKSVNQDLNSKMNDANAEIERLQGSTEDKINELRDEAASVENSTSAKIEDLVSKFNESTLEIDQLRNTLNSKVNDAKAEIERLQSSSEDKINDLDTKLSEQRTTLSNADDTATRNLANLASKVTQVASVAGTWPTGRYCIFRAGGSCPSGFTEHYGKATEIYGFMPADYTTQVTFGDSFLGCNNGCENGYNERDIEIRINTCCK